jgi:hypothetical protein
MDAPARHGYEALVVTVRRAAVTFAACVLLELGLTACGRRSADVGGQPADWPAINPGCERIALFPAGQPPPQRHHVLQEIHGSWDEPDKNLRHWLINKACAAGAHAVVEVIETQGAGEDGPVWNIRGLAIVYF